MAISAEIPRSCQVFKAHPIVALGIAKSALLRPLRASCMSLVILTAASSQQEYIPMLFFLVLFRHGQESSARVAAEAHCWHSNTDRHTVY